MGGIGRIAFNLAKHLGERPRGHRITAVLGSDVPEDIDFPNTEIIQTEAAMIDERFEQLGLPVVLSDIRADLYVNTTFSVPALKTSKYQIAVIHDVVFEDHPEWVEPGLCAYLRRWSLFAAKHADRIVTVSDFSANRIREVYGVDKAKILRIYNGTGEEAFAPVPQEEIERVRNKYALPRGYLFYLGTLEPKKGTSELLRAFSQLAKDRFDSNLVLAGGLGGPQYDLDKAVSETGYPDRVKRLGYVDERDKEALLAGCQVFVYPSLYEGFGLPPLEAMAHGTPCVVSNATSIPEVVGDCALKVDIRDTDEFVRTLERAITDTGFRKEAREAGPRWAEQFSWEQAANQYLDLFDSLEAA